jgi:hypothetical protein
MKLKLSYYTSRRRLGERMYSSYSLTTSALDGDWVVRVTPRPRFSPGERTPGTHCTGGWVGPRDGLDTEATGEILSPLPGIEPRSPGRPDRRQTLYWLRYTHLYYVLIQYSKTWSKCLSKYLQWVNFLVLSLCVFCVVVTLKCTFTFTLNVTQTIFQAASTSPKLRLQVVTNFDNTHAKYERGWVKKVAVSQAATGIHFLMETPSNDKGREEHE